MTPPASGSKQSFGIETGKCCKWDRERTSNHRPGVDGAIAKSRPRGPDALLTSDGRGDSLNATASFHIPVFCVCKRRLPAIDRWKELGWLVPALAGLHKRKPISGECAQDVVGFRSIGQS